MEAVNEVENNERTKREIKAFSILLEHTTVSGIRTNERKYA